jgi:hypothetical protein
MTVLDASGESAAVPPLWHCDTESIEPATALVTDFATPSGWNSTSGKWMTPGGNLTGGKYGYGGIKAGTNISSSAVTVTDGTLTVIGNVDVADYAGFGMSFDQCVNTTRWNGVQFLLSGSAAGCHMLFELKTFEEQGASNGGGCTATNCYQFPRVPVQIGSAPVTVTFSQLENTGTPAMAEDFAKEIIGFQWQLQSASPADADGGAQSACTGISVSVDDVSWVHQ